MVAVARIAGRYSSAPFPSVTAARADAFVILLSCIAGGIAYQLSVGNPMPDILPHCAICLLASIIYILRMSGNSYYDFPDSAKPRVEIREILVCWFTTGLMLAFFAFLLKVSVDHSRGAFVVLYFLAAAAYSECASSPGLRWLLRYQKERSDVATLS